MCRFLVDNGGWLHQIGRPWECESCFRPDAGEEFGNCSTIIDGCAKDGHHSHALELFKQFKKTGIRPDSVLLCMILSIVGVPHHMIGKHTIIWKFIKALSLIKKCEEFKVNCGKWRKSKWHVLQCSKCLEAGSSFLKVGYVIIFWCSVSHL